MHIITSTQDLHDTHDTLAHSGHAPANLCRPSHTELDRLFVLLNEWTTVNFTSFIPKDMQASCPRLLPLPSLQPPPSTLPPFRAVAAQFFLCAFECIRRDMLSHSTVRLSTRPHVILAFIY